MVGPPHSRVAGKSDTREITSEIPNLPLGCQPQGTTYRWRYGGHSPAFGWRWPMFAGCMGWPMFPLLTSGSPHEQEGNYDTQYAIVYHSFHAQTILEMYSRSGNPRIDILSSQTPAMHHCMGPRELTRFTFCSSGRKFHEFEISSGANFEPVFTPSLRKGKSLG